MSPRVFLPFGPWLLTLLLGGYALASKPRCRLERLLPPEGGKVQALAAVVELEGQVDLDRPAQSFRLLMNKKTLARGERSVPFIRSGIDIYIVLLVEISALYGKSFEKVKEALHEFLEAIPTARVKLVTFGNEVEAPAGQNFIPAGAIASSIDDLNPDDEGDIQLVHGVRDGLLSLNRVKPPRDKDGRERPEPRKLIVVLSDGLNATMDRQIFRQLGDDLRKNRVSLFPVAFSPNDDRFPMLNLGELAKRSSGTFRWARMEEDLKDQFGSLAEELKSLQVLSFSGDKVEDIDEKDLASATFSLRCGDLLSNPYSFSGVVTQEGGWRWWHYVLTLLGSLFGLWLLAQGAVLVLDRRQKRLAMAYAGGQMPYPPPGQMPYPPQGQMPYPPPVPPGAYPYPAPVQKGGQVVPDLVRHAPASPVLILIGGARAGERVPLPAHLTIGKAGTGAGTLMIPDDPTVSSRHCELRRDGAGVTLTDLGSTNGTFVNDRRLSGPTRLADGDIIRIGTGTQLKFRLE